MFSAKNIVPVHGPYRIVYQSKVLFGDLFGIGTVCVHHPNIIAPTGITGEADVFAIWAISGLYFKGMAAPD